VAEKVRVTEAKAHLSELMARVGYGGERFVNDLHTGKQDHH